MSSLKERNSNVYQSISTRHKKTIPGGKSSEETVRVHTIKIV
jgi:hypothetical protein